MQLFKRAVTLVVENLDAETTLLIEKLNVEFDITRTVEKEPSTLSAVVYNLSEDTRSKLESGDRQILTLKAGYGEDLHNLFKGDLRIVRHARDGADIATTLSAGDGRRGALNWVRKWFPKNTSIRTIFSFLMNAAEIGTGNLEEGLDIEETNGLPDSIRAGMVVQGYALDELDQLANSRGIDFSVQDGEAQFLRIGDVKEGIPITVVEPSTGLIGSPTIDNEGVMACTMLLRPNVFPGARLDVKSEFVSGRFKVIRADYNGSVYGQEFSIAIEGKELK